jgi:hypothetical protein
MPDDNRPAWIGRNLGGIRRSPRLWRQIKIIAGRIVAGLLILAGVVVVGVGLLLGLWLGFFVALGDGH